MTYSLHEDPNTFPRDTSAYFSEWKIIPRNAVEKNIKNGVFRTSTSSKHSLLRIITAF